MIQITFNIIFVLFDVFDNIFDIIPYFFAKIVNVVGIT